MKNNRFFRLKKPDLDKIDRQKIINGLIRGNVDLFKFIKEISEINYFYWDKVRYHEPAPEGISREELWMMVKFARKAQSIKSTIRDHDKKHFEWVKLDYFEGFFHELDMHAGGELFVGKASIDRTSRQRLISRGIIEEAIASSQLEGAATTRKVAKEMIRENKKPRNESEQMIMNNYLTMRALEEDYKTRRLDMDLLKELHKMITKDTFDSEGKEPRMRKDGEAVVVSVGPDVYHEAPEMSFVKEELKRLINFSNDELGEETFVHPIIKATMLHFWLGYLHPFTEGNGRLARLLFYWYLLKNGYWAFAYLPISKNIKQSPGQYKMAYIYSEQDDNDLTYFIDYNIRKIKLALDDFHKYLDKQIAANRQMKKIAGADYGLNDRQAYLLQYLRGDSDGRTSVGEHMVAYGISRITASKDLKELVEKGFLKAMTKGRKIYYYGAEKIKDLF